MNPESPFAPEQDVAPHPGPRVYGVPRRYDLATLMAVCLAFACLFGILRAIRTPPLLMALVGGFLATVGIAQALLFGGKSPRAASMLAGMAFPLVAGIVMHVLYEYPHMDYEGLILLLFWTVPWGAVLGYLAGAMVGGVFLIADSFRIFTKRL